MMRDLMRAGMYRMGRDRILKATLIFSLVYGVGFALFCRVQAVIEGGEFLIPLFAAMAAYIALTVGGEQSTGVMRNQEASGHSRAQIICSEFLCGVTACVAMLALFLLPFGVLCGTLLRGVPLRGLCMALLSILIGTVCYAVLFTALSAAIGSRAIGLIACLALIAGIVFVSYECELSLGCVEYIGIETMGENGVFDTEWVPNPRYVGGALREVFKVIDGVMPQGQVDGGMLYLDLCAKEVPLDDGSIRFSDVANVGFYPLYGALLSAVTILAGGLGFRRKELK